MEYINPFKPTAGKMPPVLVGRDKVINDFIEGMANGSGAPGRLMRVTGPRGSGKTVVLSELASIAEEQGWLVVNVSGTTGLVDSIARKLKKSPLIQDAKLSVGSAPISIEVHATRQVEEDFESLLEHAGKTMSARGKGLLVTVDEVQDASIDEMRELATAVQFLIRDDLDVAFVFAGITTGVLDLLNGEAMTFLRRAKPEELKEIPLDEVSASLRAAIEHSGLSISDKALDIATHATAGYAYLIQLVGYHVWRRAWLRCRSTEHSIEISEQDACLGVADAEEEFRDAVLETAISGLPKTCIDIIMFMMNMGNVVSTAEIAQQLGKTTGYLSPYRRQLIARQIVEQTAPGYIAFSIPFMREFLQARGKEILARYGE